MARIWLNGSHGKFIKWSDVATGTEFSGTFGGLRQGPFGWLTDLETAEGPLTLPVLTVLERQLARVRPGAAITIQYGGKQSNARTGRDFHDFNVAVEEGDVRPEPRRVPAHADGEAVPF